eukprot:4889955-Amphidinium_carterae.1
MGQCASTTTLAGDCSSLLDARLRFRLFHIDGAHYLEAALHDITTVACSMVQGGVVLIDDVHNFGWPGVQDCNTLSRPLRTARALAKNMKRQKFQKQHQEKGNENLNRSPLLKEGQ